LGDLQAGQFWNQGPYRSESFQVLAVVAPRSDNHCCIPGEEPDVLVVVWPHWIVGGQHVPWVGCAISKRIEHNQTRIAPRLRIGDAPANSWIILCFICRRWV